MGSGRSWKAVAREVSACGVRSLALRGDVSDAASVQSMVDAVGATFGRLDILVNNAGLAVGPAPVVAMEEAAWRRTLEVNATGTFLCCKHALPLMIEGGRGGRIVNMASLAADRPRIYASAYAASKAAVVALTRALALEVAEFGITVNAVLPGDIDTAFKQWSLELEAMIRGQLHRAGDGRTGGAHPGGPDGHAGGCGPCCCFSCLARGRLCHRPGLCPERRTRVDIARSFPEAGKEKR